MIVVADTAPINYLIQIRQANILHVLYQSVLIPPAVLGELSAPKAPQIVRNWVENLPAWTRVSSPSVPARAELAKLDLGEREAIELVLEVGADLLLIDERAGSIQARELGVLTTGTLGVLLDAGAQALIDPLESYSQLVRTTTFRTSARLEQAFRVQCQQFRKR